MSTRHYKTLVFALQLTMPLMAGGDLPRGMVKIPAGIFIMGSETGVDAQPKHEVYLDGFYMDKYEVTQGDYEKLIGINPSATKERLEITEKLKDPEYKLTAPFAPVNENYPADEVSWYDAARYCNARSKAEGLDPCYDEETWECDFSKNGYRLPTEAEWEYACRAGTDTRYFWGDDESKMSEYVNYWPDGAVWFEAIMKWNTNLDDDSEFIWDKPFPVMLPVGSKKPNPWGLYDILGNAKEWCNDWYDRGYYGISSGKNPRGPDKGRNKVIRGGSFSTGGRIAKRGGDTPTRSPHFAGFRCVRNAPKDEDKKEEERKE